MSPWVLTYMYTLLPEASGSTSWLLLLALVGLSFSPGHNQPQPGTSQELCGPSTREGLHSHPAGSGRVAPWQGRDFLLWLLLSNTRQCILEASRIPSTKVGYSFQAQDSPSTAAKPTLPLILPSACTSAPDFLTGAPFWA